jgi:hypothetical protein
MNERVRFTLTAFGTKFTVRRNWLFACTTCYLRPRKDFFNKVLEGSYYTDMKLQNDFVF